MIQTIKVPNFKSNNLVSETRLDADALVNATTFTLQNTAGFTTGDYIILGTPGAETAEILIVATVPTSTSLTTTAGSKLAHSKYDYIHSLFGNQVKIYRAPNVDGTQPADGTYVLLGTSTIQADSGMTAYNDAGGSDSYWYKYTYYNSTTATETNLADSASSRGGGSGDYCTIDAIRNAAGFRNAPYVTDDMIDAKRQAAQSEINASLNDKYTVPFTAPINPWIAEICTELAAGLLLVDQYSATNTSNTADGMKRIAEARANIEQLALGNKILTGSTGTPTTTVETPKSWPNETTATASSDDGGAPRIFRMSDIQGYTDRRL